MLDYLIKGGTLVDGTGSPPRVADVGIRGGRIVAIGEVDEGASTTLDAGGLVVCPGFIDPHTHYDAQLLWDPAASPSNIHGVTTIIAGNCGFTLAPLKARDADYLRRMMAKVEGMPLAALENGVDWKWETFADYLNRLEGHLGVNAGFLVGHCALRRYVMGEASVGGEATPEQVDAMVQLLHECIEAGGLGFSTTLSKTHSDGDGQPVPSRWSNRDELLALCAAVKAHEGTTLEGIVDGCLDRFTDDEIDLFIAMSLAANRPINWNVLTVDSHEPDRVPRQLSASTRAREAGARIVALTMPVQVPMNMSFLNYCALNMLPDWGPILGLPVPERIEKLRDPATRRFMLERAGSEEAGVFRRLADFANYVIGDTYSAANEGLKGRVVADIARERGQDPFDTLVEIVINDDLRTILWPIPPDGDDASWALRKQVWDDDRAMLGGSDAGAHLDRMCGAPYTTRFLGDCLRGRRLEPLERAVQMLTDEPARLFGLRGRGRIAEGYAADVVVFDPETVGAEHATLVNDLPGGTARLTAAANGIVRVLVNGVETVADNQAVGALPGTVLRSGRDTETVLP
ncbi:N-acyl-D-amino-acid deacylase family protein [Rhabdothermincola sp.]|uniref:N-acyl-D-amino-acid deacylase family protein n=1 Tax=Rhabdothermincola sp. TaxID=2820405 RepID=UPI002FE226F2